MKLQVDIKALETIRAREVASRDAVHEHTLDWYTYDNRVRLIDEIVDTFIQIVRVETEVQAEPDKPKQVVSKKTTKKSLNAGDPTDDLDVKE